MQASDGLGVIAGTFKGAGVVGVPEVARVQGMIDVAMLIEGILVLEIAASAGVGVAASIVGVAGITIRGTSVVDASDADM